MLLDGNGEVLMLEIYLKVIRNRYENKVKKGEKLSSNQSYQGLDMEVWTALNQGKVVEIDSMPKICKSQLEEVKGVNNG